MTRIPNYRPADRPDPAKPRRVRRGKRLHTKERPVGSSTLAKQFINLAESGASREILSEGLEYAVAGQVASFDVMTGKISAKVQGRPRRPYSVEIIIPPFSENDWNRLMERLAGEAGSVAALMDHQVNETVLNALAEIDLALIPTSASELRFTCSCMDDDDHNENSESITDSAVPCKHADALALVITELLDLNPMTAFTLRGIAPETLIERLRLQRLMISGGGTAHAVQEVDLSELTPDLTANLETTCESFWQTGLELHAVTDDLIAREAPRHALLRRLGQSPFVNESKFPMVGLLATCYDIISESARRELMENNDNADPHADESW